MLKIEQLYYLCMVDKFQSIKIAAESIPVTPSAVSVGISRLEKEIGIQLLKRSYRGVEITDEGKLIVARANKIFDELDNIDTLVRNIKVKSQMINDVPLNVYLPKDYYQSGLNNIIDYANENKITNMSFPENNYSLDELLKKIDADANSIVINFFKEPTDEVFNKYSNISYIKLQIVQPCIWFDESFSLINNSTREITLKEVLKLPIIKYTSGDEYNNIINMNLKKYGKLNIIEESSNIMFVFKKLNQGKGVFLTVDKKIYFGKEGPQIIWKTIPIRINLQFAIMICYNKNISEKNYEIIKKLEKDAVIY